MYFFVVKLLKIVSQCFINRSQSFKILVLKKNQNSNYVLKEFVAHGAKDILMRSVPFVRTNMKIGFFLNIKDETRAH